jgi:uncharacterized membrane protein
MRTYLLPAIAGLVLGGIIHIVTTLAMPQLALNDAYSRLARLGPVNTALLLPDPTPAGSVLPRMDPAFISAVCLYNLKAGPLNVRVPTTPDYTSISFYTRHGLAYYALNDHAAGQRTIELHLMTPAQRAALPEDEEITSADRLIVESPSADGIVMVRAFVRDHSVREEIRARVAKLSCKIES